MTGIILAGVSSNSGKSTIAMGLLRALKNRGVNVVAGKVGPDYIDIAFHSVACGNKSVNIDLWAMNEACVNSQIDILENSADFAVIEGVMGLFDGAADGSASTAHVARKTGYPIILVLDAFGQSTSISAIVKGFCTLEDDINIAGIILNRTGSETHIQILKDALQKYVPEIPYLGSLSRNDAVVLENRHLGLVQADEHKNIERFLENSCAWIEAHLDLDSLMKIARLAKPVGQKKAVPIAPLGKHIAIAKDKAFNFIYQHILNGWENAGVEISFFSPLANEAPNPQADSVYLAGGYPELYGEILTNNTIFMDAIKAMANANKVIFGECGGFMVLGEAIIDRAGKKHNMLNLLPVITSFEKPKLHLSYRQITTLLDSPFGKANTLLRGHEFHYASIVSSDKNSANAKPLFDVVDALGGKAETVGLNVGSVYGSYIHLIDTV